MPSRLGSSPGSAARYTRPRALPRIARAEAAGSGPDAVEGPLLAAGHRGHEPLPVVVQIVVDAEALDVRHLELLPGCPGVIEGDPRIGHPGPRRVCVTEGLMRDRSALGRALHHEGDDQVVLRGSACEREFDQRVGFLKLVQPNHLALRPVVAPAGGRTLPIVQSHARTLAAHQGALGSSMRR